MIRTLCALALLLLTLPTPAQPNDPFAPPARGFVSTQPAPSWEHALVTGNGTIGALVPGHPHDETLYLTHAALYLPRETCGHYIDLASHLAEIRRLCLAGDYARAGNVIAQTRKAAGYADQRDPFIAAFTLHIRQPESKVSRYQRAVDFMTAEAHVAVTDATGTFRRSAFVSRPDDVIVLRLAGDHKLSATLSFESLPAANDKEKAVIDDGVKSTEQGVRDGLLYFRTRFAHENPWNPNLGYEGVGKVITRGGTRTATDSALQIEGADEILVLVQIRPLLKASNQSTNLPALHQALDALGADYAALLAPHAKIHGDLMSRVTFSLGAPPADRAKATEQLNRESEKMDAPLAQIERAFDAGRYNILCSTGLHPPNLQGLWTGTWLAPWSGSFTTDGNLPVAVAFLLPGNTPELMEPFFRYYDDRLPGFRENARALYNARGPHVPAQLTLSPRETDFSPAYPLNYWHAAAAWACQFYYDYYQRTGDEKFLADRAYPLMKETAAFYEDFLTVTDDAGRLVFVPSYSPENEPGNTKVPTSINATIEVAAAKQLLRHAIAAAKQLNRDADLQAKWSAILSKLPDYQVAPDGSFREWLWPGLDENHQHRHCSQLYALYDEMPEEILENPALLKAVRHTIRQRLDFQESHPVMAFGLVLLGLAAEHTRTPDLTQEIINFLAKGYWSTGMVSFHNRHQLFNADLSGGFPNLCASALVYADPGKIEFFPAKPPQWTKGSLKGLRLRGNLLLQDLTWDGPTAHATLLSPTDQTLTLTSPTTPPRPITLRANTPTTLSL